jgi:hypothetical protein
MGGVDLGNPAISSKIKQDAMKRGSVLFGLQGIK